MGGKRVLYVCFDPARLALRERVLMERGYEVNTVLGQDGLMAAKRIRDYDFILIGDEGSLGERHNSVRRLREDFVPPLIIALCDAEEDVPGADYQVSTADSSPWSDAVADYMRRNSA